MNGIIVKAIGGIYYVEASDGIYECKARGVFRRKNISPVGGDRVEFSLEDDGSGVIEKIEERRSLLIRPPLANLDMLVFVSSTCEPRPNLLLLDKFIAIAVFKKIEPVVVFTKIDKESCDELVDIYKGAGIKTFQADNTTGEGRARDTVKMKSRQCWRASCRHLQETRALANRHCSIICFLHWGLPPTR